MFHMPDDSMASEAHQRRARGVAAELHLVVTLLNAYALYALVVSYDGTPVGRSFGGVTQLVPFWAALLHLQYSGAGLLAVVSTLARRYRNAMADVSAAASAAALAVYVVGTMIAAEGSVGGHTIHRGLASVESPMPRVLDWYVNIGGYLAHMLLAMVTKVDYPRRPYNTVFPLLGAEWAFFFWTNLCHVNNSEYVYPLLDTVYSDSWFTQLTFYAAVLGCMAFGLAVPRGMSAMRWDRARRSGTGVTAHRRKSHAQ